VTAKFGLKPSTLQKLCSVLQSYPKVQSAVIYGSRAKGTHKLGSDIDLTLKGNKLSISDLSAIEASLDDLLLPYNIDLSIFDQIENPALLDHIQRVGIEIFSAAHVNGTTG